MAAGAVQMLQKSLEAAQKDLTSTDDAIKRLTGRDPATVTPRSGPGRRISGGGGRLRAWSGDHGGPPAKRRDLVGGRNRLAERLGPRVVDGRPQDSDGEDMAAAEGEPKRPSLQSSVVTPAAAPRPKTDPGEDDKSKKRNRRMFGFLMGTLQKFKDSEEVLKKSAKERRRSEIEEKLVREEEVEKEESLRQKQELYEQRKSQKSKIVRLASHVNTIQMYEEWNAHDRLTRGYIKTKAAPPIFYLPAEHTPNTEELLIETNDKIEGTIKQRQAEIDSLVSEDTSKPSAAAQSDKPAEDSEGDRKSVV